MRGKQAPVRDIEGDVKYNDKNVAKLINYIMKEGEKPVARKIVYEAFDMIKKETKQDPRHIFNKAMKKVSPLVEARGKRVGGSNYQVPFQVRGRRRFLLGCKWIIENAESRSERSMAQKLAGEILAASQGEGGAVKKREEVYKQAEANKAFAHFAR
jgi:small subunit ribosomal protein S7